MLLSVLFGCAKTFPPKTMETVDRNIRFSALQKNPSAFEGKSVLLGGVIIETQPHSEKTVLVISQRELNFNQNPVADEKSKGRFMVSTTEFLDPAIYRKGRKVTVIGRVTGEVIRPIDGVPYRYPVLQKVSLHLWPVAENMRSEPSFQFGINFGFGF
jgi:outer membrane lipoprotein